MNTQRLITLLVITNIALLFLFFTTSTEDKPESVPPVIKARAIELVDELGNVRAQLNVEPGGEAVFRLRDANGTIRVKIGASENGSGLLMLDESTEPAVHLLAKNTGGSVTLTGKEGKKKVIEP